jgi:hypothetical protein
MTALEPQPFPIKRLVDALHQVQAGGAHVDRRVYGLLLNQPRTPELWAYEMHHLAGVLFSLAQACHDAERVLERLADG